MQQIRLNVKLNKMANKVLESMGDARSSNFQELNLNCLRSS